MWSSRISIIQLQFISPVSSLFFSFVFCLAPLAVFQTLGRVMLKDFVSFKLVMCVQSLSCVQLFETLWTEACQAPLFMGILQARILEWVAMPSSRGSSQLRDRTQVSHTAGYSLHSEPSVKPKNIGVVSLPFLQGNFLTQELNWGLLHCRHILYQLSYKRSPKSAYVQL